MNLQQSVKIMLVIETEKIKEAKNILLKYSNGLEVPKELNIKVIEEKKDAGKTEK